MVNDQIEFRSVTHAGKYGWWWPKDETGAWNGPAREFAGLASIVIGHARGKDLIVQAGGCCGMYPRLWADHFNTVVTAEPDSLNFTCLALNCQSENIIKLNTAFGYDRSPVTMRRAGQINVGEHQVRPGGRIPQIRIDDLALPACDVIQLDCEGYESFVLKGALHTVAHYRPVIVVETLDDEVQQILDAYKYAEVGRNAADKIFIPQ